MSFIKKLFSKTPAVPSKNADPAPQEPEDLAPLIVPIVKPGQGPAKTLTIDGKAHELPKGSLPVSAPLDFDALRLVFGIDRDVAYEWLQNKHLGEGDCDLKKDDVLNIAFSNFIRKVGNSMSINMIGDDIGMITEAEGLESSLFLVSSVWNAIFQVLDTDAAVFGLPAQDVFIFARADNKEAVATLKEQVEALYNSEETRKPISPRLYIERGNGTEIYTA